MKARFKAYEDMTALPKCCAQTRQALRGWAGAEVEVSTVVVLMDEDCPFCGFHYVARGYRSAIGSIPFDAIDIDEGHDATV